MLYAPSLLHGCIHKAPDLVEDGLPCFQRFPEDFVDLWNGQAEEAAHILPEELPQLLCAACLHSAPLPF